MEIRNGVLYIFGLTLVEYAGIALAIAGLYCWVLVFGLIGGL